MDPKGAAIIVFTTKLNTLESSFKSGGDNSNKKNANGNLSKSKGQHGNGTGGGNKNGNDKKKGLPKWRITFRGNEIVQDRKNMVWCKHHKKEGKYDGMYYLKPHNHTEWEERVNKNKEARRLEQDKQKSDSSSSSSKSSSNLTDSQSKLVLSNNLKAVLCTNCSLSDDQVKDM
eukprot:2409722-Ditylum_brightwellii.AAC.1